MIEPETARHQWALRSHDGNPNASLAAQSTHSGFGTHSLMTIALRWKWSIAAAAFVAAIITYAFLTQVPPTFTAKTQVMLSSGTMPVINIPNVVPEANPNVAYLQSAVIVMQSSDVLRDVVRELDLDRRKEFNPALRTPNLLAQVTGFLRETAEAILPDWGEIAAGDPPGETDPLSGTIRGLRQAVVVRVLGESQVVEVAARSSSPRLAAAIADAVAQNYIKGELETKYLAGGQATEWLEGRAEDLRDVLTASERRVSEFRKSQIADGEEMAAELEPRLLEITEALSRLRIEQSDLMARSKEVSHLVDEGNFVALAELLDRPTISALYEQLAELEADITQQERLFGDHAAVRRLRQDRDQIELRLREEARGFLSGLAVRIEVIETRRAELDTQLQAARAQLADREQAELQLLELEREAEASREVYNRFLLRLKEVRERSQFQRADARIISRADIPVFPSAPQKVKLSAIAAITGGAIALLLVALYGDNRPRVADPQQIALRTGVASVSQIPLLRRSGTSLGLLERVRDAPDSPEARAVRRLRSSVSPETPCPAELVMVTSVDDGEGKTTLCLSLAEAFSRLGFNTALVSADPGNGNLAAEIARCDAIGFDFVDWTDLVVPSDGQASAEGGMAKLIGMLKLRNVIIVDMPPALRSDDVLDFGLLANHTIVACTWDKTPRETLEHCIEALHDAGAAIDAIVINKVPRRRMSDSEQRPNPYSPPRVPPPRALPPPDPTA